MVGNSVSVVSSVNTGGEVWWTTDVKLETELSKYKYRPVKEVKFFYEKASEKLKGYCQVLFFDPFAATACKERMNGRGGGNWGRGNPNLIFFCLNLIFNLIKL